MVTLLTLNEDLFLLTGDREINLDDQQAEAVRRVQSMELSEDEGTVTFLQGEYGSGKTLVGIGKAKLYAAKREQQGKSVKILFIGGYQSKLLRDDVVHRNCDIEVKCIEDEDMCGKQDPSIEEVNNLNRKLADHDHFHYVVIYDELLYKSDYTELEAVKTVDIIMIVPFRPHDMSLGCGLNIRIELTLC